MTIFEAIEADDLALLNALIARGADVHARSASGLSALHLAAARGDLDAARALLDAGADPNSPSLEPRLGAAAFPAGPDAAVADLSTSGGASALAGLIGAIWEASKPKATDVQGHTPLISAALGGHADMLRVLLERGADVNARDSDGFTALTFAVATGQRAALELLISRGADLEAKTRDGLTPLMLAAQDGRLGFVRTLLDAGADPFAESKALMFTLTPLGLAVQGGHHAVADALIAAGAMGMATPLQMGVALGKAVEENRPDVVRSLIAAGADLNSQVGGGDHLHTAAERGHVEMIGLLLRAGAELEGRASFRGASPLMVAAEHGQEEAVAALLASGANVHASGGASLLLAAREGHAGVVRALLAAGADRNTANGEGRTAAEVAALYGHDEVVAVLSEAMTPALRDARLAGAAAAGDARRLGALLRDGADPEALGRRPGDHGSRPALSLAAEGGHLDAVLALLAGGASVDGRALEGQTPLMYAAAAGQAAVVRALLAAGADPNTRADRAGRDAGKTPLMFATEAGHFDAARALLEGRASVHVKDALSLGDRENGPTGRTALAYAVMSDHADADLVSLLLDAGAHSDARDESGGTPLIHAAFVGKFEIVRRLLAAGADANSPARGDMGNTALEAVAMNDDATVYQLLRDAGAKPREHGKLPEALRTAILRGATSLIDQLLADGVDVNAKDPGGATPLLTAAMMGRLEVARKLLDLGADPDGGSPGSDRPLHRAAVMGHADIIRLLLGAGADPNALGSESLTPLLALAREGGRMPIANASGLLDCARALLAAGADALALADGRTALAYASERGYDGLVAVLREAVSGGAP